MVTLFTGRDNDIVCNWFMDTTRYPYLTKQFGITVFSDALLPAMASHDSLSILLDVRLEI